MPRTIAALVVLLIPAAAWAGGEEIPDNGAQALGRGGAFTAKADDLTALEYNVAGLAMARGTRVLFSANIVNASADFQRAGTYPTMAGVPYSGQPFPAVSEQGGAFFAPMFVVASDLGTKKWTVAAGAFGPSAYGKSTWPTQVSVAGQPAPAPQRYDLVSEDLLQIFPTVAVAWRPLDFISVGAAFNWVYTAPKFRQAVYLPLAPAGSENPYYDVDATIDVSDTFEPAYTLGALARLTENLQVGVNYRSSADIDASGTVKLSTVPNDPNGPARITPMFPNGGNTARVSHFRSGMPQVIRGGIRYIFRDGDTDRADLELDTVWENWSAKLQDINIELDPSSVTPAPPVTSPHHWNDTVSVRLGGSYSLDTMVGVWNFRGGTYYETAAASDAWSRLDFRAWEHIGFTAGAGWTTKGLTLNAGLAYIYMPTREVSNSEVRQTIALPGQDPTTQPVVGAGKWSAGYTIFTLGLEYKFDPFR